MLAALHDEFAAAKMGFSKAKEERRQGFLTHQAKSLPTSLTQLDTKHEREEAVQMFKGVLGYVRREIASSNPVRDEQIRSSRRGRAGGCSRTPRVGTDGRRRDQPVPEHARARAWCRAA